MSVIDKRLNIRHCWNYTDRAKLNYLEKNQPQCQFIHQKSQVDWHGFHLGSPRWERERLSRGAEVRQRIDGASCVLVHYVHDRLLKKIAASGVDSKVVVWIREFLIDRSQRGRVGRHYSEEVRVTSGVPHRGVLDPLLFLAYIKDILRDIE